MGPSYTGKPAHTEEPDVHSLRTSHNCAPSLCHSPRTYIQYSELLQCLGAAHLQWQVDLEPRLPHNVLQADVMTVPMHALRVRLKTRHHNLKRPSPSRDNADDAQPQPTARRSAGPHRY